MKKNMMVVMMTWILMLTGCSSVAGDPTNNVENNWGTECLELEESETVLEIFTDNTEVIIEPITETIKETECTEGFAEVTDTEEKIIETEFVMVEKNKEKSSGSGDSTEKADISARIEESTSNAVAYEGEENAVVNNSQTEWTEEEIENFWDEFENIDGSFETVTDGHGTGIEIEISLIP